MKIEFVKSAVLEKDYPFSHRSEVAIVGRSNAGKSSFINALGGRQSRIAKVSSSPGKTRLLNFFNMGDHYTLVDMPGYGFAARSKGEKDEWRPMVETYLKKRENLAGLLLIMDIRREWSNDEQLMLDWVSAREVPMAIVLNKMDKAKKNQQVQMARRLAEMANVESVFLISALKRTGVRELEEYIFKNWVKGDS